MARKTEQDERPQDEEAPEPRERPNADDVEAEQSGADEQARESAPEPESEQTRSAGEQQVAEQRKAECEQRPADRNRESTDAILSEQGTDYDTAQRQLTVERGFDPDRPMVSHVEAWETGYAGQVADPTPNEAYQAGGDESEAARADLRAATRGRLPRD